MLPTNPAFSGRRRLAPSADRAALKTDYLLPGVASVRWFVTGPFPPYRRKVPAAGLDLITRLCNITIMCNNLPETMALGPDQLSVLGSPIRLRVLEILCLRERTVGDLAEDLGREAPSNLYYHLNKLLRSGLVTVVRSEQRRGALEKYYRAVARGFSVPIGAGGNKAPGDLADLAASSMENALRDLTAAVDAGEVQTVNDLLLSRVIIRTSREKSEYLRHKLESWLHEFSDANGEGDVELTASVMMFHRAPHGGGR